MAVVKKVVLNVLGTDGNDVLKNTGAIEIIDGGAGIDKVVFAEGTRGISVNLKTGQVIDSFGNRETIKNVEIVEGTAFNDVITGSDGTDYLIGGGGNDVLNGGKGNDELYGGTGDDRLNGGDGNDLIVGGQGKDIINGGNGFDTVNYSDEGGAKGVSVNLATGKASDSYGDADTLSSIERVVGTDLADELVGNSSVNVLEGGGGDDLIDGGAGNDLLLGGFGTDKILGGSGNDVLVGGHGNDKLDGGSGTDTVDYSLDGGWRGISLDLTRASADDTWGSSDTLVSIENVIGSQFDDYIFGNKGNNVFTGGLGNDILTGGGGNDTFVFGAGHGNDKIVDFNAGDKLDLSALGFRSVEGVLAVSAGHDLGAVITTGEGSSIVLVDVNINSLASLGYIFA